MNETMNATSAAERQPRYLGLLEIQTQLMDIHQHIIDLNVKLGVRPRSQVKMPSPQIIEAPKMSEPESLVSVLEQLPSMVSSKVTQIHNLLNNLEDNLI